MARSRRERRKDVDHKTQRRRLVRLQGDIAMQILHYLTTKGWKKKELAEKADMKMSYLSRVLSGNANLTLGTICKLAEALDEEIVVTPLFYEELAPQLKECASIE